MAAPRSRRVVFDHWLMGFRRRVAVWRVVPMGRGRAGDLWSESERRLFRMRGKEIAK